MASAKLQESPAFEPAETVEGRFQKLAATWRKETALESSMSRLVEHPAYQEIIRLGADVVPILLRELEKDPDHWFWALMTLTGANPVPDCDSGDLKKMAERWLQWGQQQGYQW